MKEDDNYLWIVNHLTGGTKKEFFDIKLNYEPQRNIVAIKAFYTNGYKEIDIDKEFYSPRLIAQFVDQYGEALTVKQLTVIKDFLNEKLGPDTE